MAVGTKVHRGVHRPGAAVRARHGIGPDRRRWIGLPGRLFTQHTVRLIAAPGKFESKKFCFDERINGPCTLVNFCSSFFLETPLCGPSNSTFLTMPYPRWIRS